MDAMRIIKPSVSIPNNTLLHRTKFNIGSLRVKQSRPLLSFPIYHTATILVPILPTNYKLSPTSTSFRYCCSKEDNYVEATTDSDTGVWQRHDLKLQTPFVWMLFLVALIKLQPPFVWMLFLIALKLQTPFIWMLFLRAIKCVFSAISKLIPRPIYRSFLLYVDKLELRHGSKKMEPMNISFDDLVGVDATIRKFRYITTILKGKKEDNRLLPFGIILFGPPGTGKNTFVQAFARETDVSFFPVYACDIVSGDVQIERLFDEARACSPSIVYIRFVDAIGKPGGYESSEALGQLHTEIEKCKDNGSVVIVIVSSDYPKNLDPSLLDSHMFLDQVHFGKPDEDDRRKFIGLHLKRVVREDDKETFCDIVASQTPGLVWCELRSIVLRCTASAAIRGDPYVNMDDVFQVLEEINNNVLSNLDKPMTLESMRRRVESVASGSQK